MTTDDESASPLLSLLSQVEQGVHLRRRDLLGRIEPVEVALRRYARALEEEAALEYARNHGLKLPRISGVVATAAAEALLVAVKNLPELRSKTEAGRAPEAVASPTSNPAAARRSPATPSAPASAPSPGEATSQARPLSDVLPRVSAACLSRKLVIVGALAGRKKPLPLPLDDATEWLDTSDSGRAAQALPARIRQGGLFGLIICDQSVSHQHTEPAVAAARASGLPIGFAGKGGAGAIARALSAIEEQLAAAAGSSHAARTRR